MLDKYRYIFRIMGLVMALVTAVTLIVPVSSTVYAVSRKSRVTISPLPDEVAVVDGETAAVTVKATSSAGGTLKYQWYHAQPGSIKFNKSSITSRTYKVTMGEKRDGRRIFCVVTDRYGNTAASEIVTLNRIDPITVTQQPLDVVADDGRVARVYAKADGEGTLHYQWYIRKEGSKNFYKSSVTSATYSTKMSGKRDGRQIYCVITDDYGQKVTTRTATLSMSVPIAITRQPVDVAVQDGKIAKVSVKAVSDGPLRYQWYIRKEGSKNFYESTCTSATYSTRMSENRDGRQIYCVITDEAGRSVTTRTVTLRLRTDFHVHTFGEETPVGRTNQGYAFLRTCKACGQEDTVYYDALLTFVDDDGKMQAMLHWEKIIDATGIKMTAALIGSQMHDETDYDTWWEYAGWDLLSRMQRKGVDFVNHTYSHKRLTGFTEAELHQDFKMAKSALKAYGIESDVLVYPFNAHNALVESVADDYFKAAFGGESMVVTDIAYDSYGLTRLNINDSSTTKAIRFDEESEVACVGVKQLETLQSEMHSAISTGGWLVYMTHAYDSPAGQYFFDEHAEQTVIDFCRYVQGMNNVKIVTLTEGLAAAAIVG